MSTLDPPRTPLLALLRALETDARRDEFALLAGTPTSYLYQLAGCYKGRRACRVDLAKRIADASRTMAAKYGITPITMEQLACQCDRVRAAEKV